MCMGWGVVGSAFLMPQRRSIYKGRYRLMRYPGQTPRTGPAQAERAGEGRLGGGREYSAQQEEVVGKDDQLCRGGDCKAAGIGALPYFIKPRKQRWGHYLGGGLDHFFQNKGRRESEGA